MHCGAPACAPLPPGFRWTWWRGAGAVVWEVSLASPSTHTHLVTRLARASSWVAGGQRLKSARVEGELELLGPGPRMTPMERGCLLTDFHQCHPLLPGAQNDSTELGLWI